MYVCVCVSIYKRTAAGSEISLEEHHLDVAAVAREANRLNVLLHAQQWTNHSGGGGTVCVFVCLGVCVCLSVCEGD